MILSYSKLTETIKQNITNGIVVSKRQFSKEMFKGGKAVTSELKKLAPLLNQQYFSAEGGLPRTILMYLTHGYDMFKEVIHFLVKELHFDLNLMYVLIVTFVRTNCSI